MRNAIRIAVIATVLLLCACVDAPLAPKECQVVQPSDTFTAKWGGKYCMSVVYPDTARRP